MLCLPITYEYIFIGGRRWPGPELEAAERMLGELRLSEASMRPRLAELEAQLAEQRFKARAVRTAFSAWSPGHASRLASQPASQPASRHDTM
eukprot:COSAG01_NODE_3319_length_6269_cov_5.161264_7_plen_92_part_00